MDTFVFLDSDVALIRTALLKLEIELCEEKENLAKERHYKGANEIGQREQRCNELRKMLGAK